MNPQVSQAGMSALYAQNAALQAATLGGGAALTAGATGLAGLAGYQALPTSATGNTASVGGLHVATASTASQDAAAASLGQAQAKKRGREDELILVHLIILVQLPINRPNPAVPKLLLLKNNTTPPASSCHAPLLEIG